MCVLSILLTEDSYGYQIIKEMDKLIDVTESTLYPILKRLVEKQLLTSYTVEHNNRLRKYYKITDLGKVNLQDQIEQWKVLKLVVDQILERKGEVSHE